MAKDSSNNNRTRLLIVAIGGFILLLILGINLGIFNNYQNNLTKLQQNNQLTIAKTVGNSIRFYYEGKIESFRLYFHTVNSIEEVSDYFYLQEDGISSVYLLDSRGGVLEFWGEDYREFLLEAELPAEGQTRLSKQILVGENHFIQLLSKEITWQGETRFVIASIEMEYVYEKIVSAVQVGKNGYSMVKDIDGIILMHKAKSQVGLDAVDGRKELYQEYNLDYTDLEDWIDEQKRNQEGSRILDSYWWDDPSISPSKKVVTFTKVPVGDDIWIVNCTLDYQELVEPINRAMILVVVASVGILLIFTILLSQVINHMNIAKTMRMEIDHLNELNSALEELKRSNEIIRHNDKLQTIGTMTGMIAHEFNNYLTPIRLYCDMVLTGDEATEELKGYVAEILEAATGAGELTKELSIYSRRDTESQRMIDLPLLEQIERSLSIVKKTLPTNITLTTQLEGENLYIRSSQGMMNQVIVNLCTNAVHAMEDKGGVLTVAGAVETGGLQEGYTITVSDTGMGIAPEVLKQIFQPFYTTKQVGSGTGLGLSIIKDLIQKSGGTIRAYSQLGEGSKFVIHLPLVQGRRETEAGEAAQIGHNENLRVLILDDKKFVGKALERLLSENFRKTAVYYSPVRALAAIKEDMDGWDVILTDYSMPVLNGLELASILRNLGVTSKIILMSGNLDSNVQWQWYVDNGIVDGVLEKPVTVADFDRVVTESESPPKS